MRDEQFFAELSSLSALKVRRVSPSLIQLLHIVMKLDPSTVLMAASISLLTGVVASYTPADAAPLVTSAQTKSCLSYMGDSVSGQEIAVDVCSVSRASEQSLDFVYYLGKEPIVSQANCRSGTWTTFPEEVQHQPQSRATQRMVSTVCRGLAELAVVFAPPSNVRTSPNGPILCTLEREGNLSTYGSTGSWHYTDACGSFGVIHSSQIRF